MSLRAACKEEKISHGAFLLWCNEDKQLADQYARARDVRADIMAEEMLEIADDTSNDDDRDKDGNLKPNSEWITRSKLRVDARKWLMSKMQPKKYGDKLQNEISGPDGKPVNFVVEYVGMDDKDD